MKEIIIIGLVALFVFFAYEASQSGNNASIIQPTSLIAEGKTPVIGHHESAERYYAVITEEIIEEEVAQ